MSLPWEPVKVIKAGSYPMKAGFDPSLPNPAHIRDPYVIGTAVAFRSDVEITSPERAEGDLRGMPANECAVGGTAIVGPGGGEDWHQHMEYYDIALYIEYGELEIGIRDADGSETVQTTGPGDFVQIPPHADHYWLNKSAGETKVVFFAHFHDRLMA